MHQFIFLAILLISCLPVSHSQDFHYHGDKGPDHWGEQYGACFGKHQSPINIEMLNVQRTSLPKLEFQNFDATPISTSIKNNGHTVMFTIDTKAKPQISGGPLNGTYQFTQLHFHWGENDTFGSEDTIEGRSFPMELHLVFSKVGYDKPLEHNDGLAVLAVFYEATDYENVFYRELSNLLHKISKSNTSAGFEHPPTLGNLIHTNLQRYFTYNGSLTTPPCAEVVTWIDFKEPIPLSHEQIEAFRLLEDSDGLPLTHNFRPTQPLNDRIVYFVTDETEDQNDLDDQSKSATEKSAKTKVKSGKSSANFLTIHNHVIALSNFILLYKIFSYF